MKIFKLLVISLVVLLRQMPAQVQMRYWYFGNGAGLDFQTSPPTVLTNGVMYTPEGCAVQTSTNGNLMFYTNGVNVYNQNHVLMANGASLFGHGSTTQSSIICKLPGSAAQYYIFTLAEMANSNGLRYSVVDMSLAAGLGSVTVKNSPVYAPCAEKLCAVQHCNGTDYWIISHEYNSAVFRSYLLTAGGLSLTPVISNVGIPVTSSLQTLGAMKVSPNGRKLGLCNYNPGSFEVFDFDRATGQITNGIILKVGTIGYGCEFSPDGTKFYGGAINEPGGQIYQWDLCAGSSQAIISSVYTITTGITVPTGALQLGPDKKIYVAQNSTNFLSAINSPDLYGAACNFSINAVNLSPRFVIYGLPAFPSSFLRVPPATFGYAVDNLSACRQVSFTASPSSATSSLIGCGASGYSLAGIAWNFGEPASGVANTSNLQNPIHTYGSNGTYTVQQILYYSCGNPDTVTKAITVFGSPPQLSGSVSGPTLLCTAASTLFAIQSNSTAAAYSWTLPAAWTGATATNSIFAYSGASGTLQVSASNGCGTSNILSLFVQVGNIPAITISSVRQPLCLGMTTTLTATGATSYTWNSGFWGNFLNVTPSITTVYSVTGRYNNGCLTSGSLQLVVMNNPTLQLSTNNFTVCKGQKFSVSAAGASNYTWNTGSIAASLVLVQPTGGVYSCIGADVNGCRDSVTFQLWVSNCTDIINLSDEATSVSWYPNPVKDILYVSCPDQMETVLSIYAPDGRLVLSRRLEERIQIIDLKDLPDGFYIVRIGSSAHQIIKCKWHDR